MMQQGGTTSKRPAGRDHRRPGVGSSRSKPPLALGLSQVCPAPQGGPFYAPVSCKARSAAGGAAPPVARSPGPGGGSSAWGSPDRESLLERRRVIHVDLDQFDPAAQFPREIGQRRAGHPAGPAPRCPEVDQHRDGRVLRNLRAAKVASSASASQGSGWWQFPQRGEPAAAAGTQFRCPQPGHLTIVPGRGPPFTRPGSRSSRPARRRRTRRG
jgi:hypothetical protein